MASIINEKEQSLKYVSKNSGDSPVVSFSTYYEKNENGTFDSVDESINMLMDSAELSISRGVNIKHFLNADSAMLIGKGQGSLRINGLFGSAKQLEELLGNPAKPCSLKRNISFSGGVLRECNGAETKTQDVELLLKDCVAVSAAITVSQQEGGIVFQSAQVVFVVTDVATK